MMSKTIEITALHDKNTIGLKDYSALDLVDFEFFPHLDHNREQFLDDLKRYSTKRKLVIYACNDGDGIIVDGDKINFFGEVLKIQSGEITTV